MGPKSTKKYQNLSRSQTIMIKIFALCLLAVAVYGSRRYGHPAPSYGYGYAPVVKVEKLDKPQAYEFSYDIKDDYHNSNGRQESGDEYGNMKGAYSIQLANGLSRWVQYVADEGGFRAVIKTNEPGTDNQSPADVDLTAEPIVVKEQPKKVVHKVHAAPSYGYHGYAAPILAICLLAVAVYGSRRYGHPAPSYGYGYAPVVKVEKLDKPQAYEFSYDIKDDYHNSNGRQESGDEYGNMKGAYSIQLANGLNRWVQYVADEGGFRAVIKTNEPGTDNQSPADVDLTAEPIVVKEEPKKVVHKVYAAPSYGHHGYAAPILALCLLAVAVYGSRRYGHPAPSYGYGYAPVVKVEKLDKPQPYEFSYDIKDDYHNSNGRQESGDEYGNMKGAYSIQLANGLTRWVQYVADEGGFRAVIKTNEPGTDNQSPADVDLTAEPIVVKEEPKKVVHKVYAAPSYGHHGYAAPSYGHRGYATPVYGYQARRHY
ncbi:Cuticle protein 10.9 [Nymphon striatum]|nr:Cuticle protein 10.9 [Nymphon striatum]